MATLFWVIFLDVSEVTMSSVTGWAGVFIVLIYILAIAWDIVAIDNMVN